MSGIGKTRGRRGIALWSAAVRRPCGLRRRRLREQAAAARAGGADGRDHRRGVTVSPDKFGAGPVRITIVNQTDDAHTVTLEGASVEASRPREPARHGHDPEVICRLAPTRCGPAPSAQSTAKSRRPSYGRPRARVVQRLAAALRRSWRLSDRQRRCLPAGSPGASCASIWSARPHTILHALEQVAGRADPVWALVSCDLTFRTSSMAASARATVERSAPRRSRRCRRGPP